MLKGRRVSSDSLRCGSETGQNLPYYQACDDESLGSGWWEVSGGAAQAGEASRDAVLREVKEETGLDASEAEGGYLFTYKRENPGEGDNYFVDVYRFVMDVEDKDLKLQMEETDGYMFATLEQIRAFAAEGKFLHYDSIKKVFEF
mgnify:CR=1 FL=1